MSSLALPNVVIVGRTNVGKSTLFNRLASEKKSLVMDAAGITRDCVTDVVTWQGRTFTLVDTGGVSFKKSSDIFVEKIRHAAIAQLEKADVVVFVCDGTVGVVAEDRDIARVIHKLEKKPILVVNKIDTNLAQERVYEFERLGFKPMITISAQHGTNIGGLLEEIVAQLPAPKKAEEEVAQPPFKLVLLGKPNVGKSSLMNLLMKQERVMVSDIPGTTREAITDRIRFYQQDIELTDTAGIRRQRSIDEPLEQMMVKTTLRAVDAADIVLLLLDASQAELANQELKLAFYAFENKHKALILIFNKQDLVDEYARTRVEMDMEQYDFFTKKLVTINTSCTTEKNVGKVLSTVYDVWQRHSQWFDNEELSLLLKTALIHKPLFHNSAPLMLLGVRQLSTAPVTIGLMVNQPRWFGPSQLAFFEGIMRKEYDLLGVPIKFVVRTRREVQQDN